MLSRYFLCLTRVKAFLNLEQYSTGVRAFSSLKRPFSPSIEQISVVKALKKSNVSVLARPGAGKTATAEAVMKSNPNARVLIVTYSKRLQLDTKHRLKKYPSADVLTFHACVLGFC